MLVKQREFRRWLEARGVVVKDGSRHLMLYYRGPRTVMSRHPGKEMPEIHRRTILKQLLLGEIEC